MVRNIDEEPQWHVDIHLTKHNNYYEAHMFYDEQHHGSGGRAQQQSQP